MSLVQILIGLAGLGFMVFIHELGHFLAARAVGIKVEAFSIGWGPRLFGFRRGDTDYRISAIPIGGYCKMKGEQDMADALSRKAETIEPSEGSFYAASPWKRIIVAFAGPFINLLFAIIVMSFVWGIGYSYQSAGTRIILLSDYPAIATEGANLVEKSPAFSAGLRTGDRIVSINGIGVESYRDVQQAVAPMANTSIDVTFERIVSSETVTIASASLIPMMDPETGAGRIGLLPWIEPVVEEVSGSALASGLKEGDRILSVAGLPVLHTIDISAALKGASNPVPIVVERDGLLSELNIQLDYNESGLPYLSFTAATRTFVVPPTDPVSALGKGIVEAWNTLVQTVRGIGLLFQGLDPVKAISGPGRIIYYIGESAEQGFSVGIGEGIRYLSQILSLISIALFFGNLLPIPALDGGQILMFVVEAIRKRPLKLKTIQRYQIAGFIMVMGLLGFALFGDIVFNYR